MVLTTGWPVRLIPAWAGKTLSRSKKSARRRAHPRTGGENGISRGGLTLLGGSSPRGRGKRTRVRRYRVPGGLIPARAGKTIFQALLTRTTGTHPRAGGENANVRAEAARAGGSSPRGRGKLHHAEAPIQQIRLIPARAGKTDFRRLR